MVFNNNNYRELNYISLKEDDIVIFTVNGVDITYTVTNSFLHNSFGSNDAIFKLLGLDASAFCENYYGYKTYDGVWPPYKNLKDASTVIIALFNIVSTQQAGEIKKLQLSIWNGLETILNGV